MRRNDAFLLAPMVRRQSESVLLAGRSQFEQPAPTTLLKAAFGPLVPCAFTDTMTGPPAMRQGQNLTTSALSDFVFGSPSRLSQTVYIQCAAGTRRGSRCSGAVICCTQTAMSLHRPGLSPMPMCSSALAVSDVLVQLSTGELSFQQCNALPRVVQGKHIHQQVPSSLRLRQVLRIQSLLFAMYTADKTNGPAEMRSYFCGARHSDRPTPFWRVSTG